MHQIFAGCFCVEDEPGDVNFVEVRGDKSPNLKAGSVVHINLMVLVFIVVVSIYYSAVEHRAV